MNQYNDDIILRVNFTKTVLRVITRTMRIVAIHHINSYFYHSDLCSFTFNQVKMQTSSHKTTKTIVVTGKEKFDFTLYIITAPKAPNIKLISNLIIDIIPFLIFIKS